MFSVPSSGVTVALLPTATVAESVLDKISGPMALSAINAAGLAQSLSSPDLEATIFMPTEEAFTTALESLGITMETLVDNQEVLVKILSFHVVPGKAMNISEIGSFEASETLLTGQKLQGYKE